MKIIVFMILLTSCCAVKEVPNQEEYCEDCEWVKLTEDDDPYDYIFPTEE